MELPWGKKQKSYVVWDGQRVVKHQEDDTVQEYLYLYERGRRGTGNCSRYGSPRADSRQRPVARRLTRRHLGVRYRLGRAPRSKR